MNTIKGFSQWINEQNAQAAKVTPGAAPVKPEGYTLTTNGIAYKYPFANDLAYSKYVYFKADPANITDSGASFDEKSEKAALIRILPSHQDWSTKTDVNIDKTTGQGSVAKGFGTKVTDSVENALEFHALMGLKQPISLEKMVQSAKTPEAGYIVDDFKDFYNTLAAMDKAAIAEWNKNWPIIWKEQCKRAGLPWAV